MAGRSADWGRIQKMAEHIRNPEYSLREFFEDCIASFPELSLFFEGSSSTLRKELKQASSGLSGEAEYQRTIGALFTVYWMLRLDGDGLAGFCNGVDEAWRQIPVRPAESDKPFAKMTAEEKRASFAETMDWKLFEDLVERAGCGRGAPCSTERIMALLCLSAFHDIMKLPMLQPIVQPEHAPYYGYEAGVRIHDHDLALSYVLECFPGLLPSYAGLPNSEKRRVLFTQGKMQFNHGWFVQAEAPPGGMLSKFKAVLQAGAEQEDIDLYFLHWITDLAGAEASPLGGAEKLVTKFPKPVLASFLWSMTYLSRLAGMSETALVEQYLEARWRVLLPEVPVPSEPSAIALMRLALMAQAEDALSVVRAFEALSVSDRACLVAELARTGCTGQAFARNSVRGGPAFLVYYAPFLLQRNNGSVAGLRAALHALCVVLRGARAVWPMSLALESSTVIIQISELKARDIHGLGQEARAVWVLLRNNDSEGTVLLRTATEVNALHMEDARFRLLDFAAEVDEDEGQEPSPEASPSKPLPPSASASAAEATPSTTCSFGTGKRILVFTDMSTECDDECALLWLLAALHRRGVPAVVELVQTDSHVRFQWMAHVFRDKFAHGGEWKLQDGGSSFQFKNVLVNMYLARSASREEMVINDMQRKAPHVALHTEEADGRTTAVRPDGSMGGPDYSEIPGGALNSVVVSAAIPDVAPEFFQRFSSCKCAYVVGTPGGINCPVPSWVDLLAALHRLAPVLYLTPQLTRTIRFPRNYVAANVYWNDTIKHTVWDNVLTCMARRPEIPPKFGNWGLILRLNVANALFCKDWYVDALGTRVEDAERPEHILRSVQSYVDRNSGDDRQLGTIMDELKFIGTDVSPNALGLVESDFNMKGEPISSAAKEAIRQAYRRELFETTLLCVLTTDALLWKNKKNVKVGLDDGGFEKVQARCGYVAPDNSLADLFGVEDAINILKILPLRWLTPAYDVVAMVCADCALEEGTDVDGGLDLLLADADETMGLGMLSQEQRELSEFPVLYTLPQTGHGVYAVGPFV